MLPIIIVQAIESEEDLNKMEQLYREYRQLLFSVANNILHDSHAAEDAVNDAFIRVIRNLDKIEDVKCPRTRNYLVVIVRNIALSAIKSNQRNGEVGVSETWQFDLQTEEEVEERYSAEQDRMYDRLSLEKVAEAIRKLPTKLKDTLYLYAVEDYSLEETAELLGISYEAAKKRVQRARKELTKMLQEDEDE